MVEIMKKEHELRSAMDKLNKLKRTIAIKKPILSVTQPPSPDKTAKIFHKGNSSISGSI